MQMENQSPQAVLSDRVPLPRITSVTQDSEFNYYGPVQASLADKASRFLAAHTDVMEEEAICAIEKFLQITREDCVGNEDQKSAYWMTIRITTPSDAFKIPRWHQDGVMFPYDEKREDMPRSKYALTLLGPRTLMLESDAHIFEVLERGKEECLWWRDQDKPRPTEDDVDEAHEKLRTWLADAFANASRYEFKEDDIVRFTWGREDSPVHSEPDFKHDRVFMTVLYGSEAELRGMCDWRDCLYEE